VQNDIQLLSSLSFLFDETFLVYLQRNLTEYCNAVNLQNMVAIFARYDILSLQQASNDVIYFAIFNKDTDSCSNLSINDSNVYTDVVLLHQSLLQPACLSVICFVRIMYLCRWLYQLLFYFSLLFYGIFVVFFTVLIALFQYTPECE